MSPKSSKARKEINKNPFTNKSANFAEQLIFLESFGKNMTASVQQNLQYISVNKLSSAERTVKLKHYQINNRMLSCFIFN